MIQSQFWISFKGLNVQSQLFTVLGMPSRKILRRCSICGKEIEILLRDDGSYEGGHFFGDIDGNEYWECDECFTNFG